MCSIRGGSSKRIIPLEIIHTQKPHQGARHLPEMGRLLGEFALLVQIGEKSPESCVDA